jgi:hypothetical protein
MPKARQPDERDKVEASFLAIYAELFERKGAILTAEPGTPRQGAYDAMLVSLVRRF